ncbi:hypothetical protein LIA77_04481 [Sarocladium implicatum]|nr:hypothetical protein LIA77_04481 [Sarocladium implicatum]
MWAMRAFGILPRTDPKGNQYRQQGSKTVHLAYERCNPRAYVTRPAENLSAGMAIRLGSPSQRIVATAQSLDQSCGSTRRVCATYHRSPRAENETIAARRRPSLAKAPIVHGLPVADTAEALGRRLARAVTHSYFGQFASFEFRSAKVWTPPRAMEPAFIFEGSASRNDDESFMRFDRREKLAAAS